MSKFIDAPEGFRIEKTADIDAGETRYVFTFDRLYTYRTLALMEELAISEEVIDKVIVRSGIEQLIENMERCIAKFKEENSDEA